MPDTPPDWSAEIRARLATLRLRPEREAEIIEELSQHLDDRYFEAIAGGASRAEARRTALGAFRAGNVLAEHMATLRQANTAAPTVLAARSGNALEDLWNESQAMQSRVNALETILDSQVPDWRKQQ